MINSQPKIINKKKFALILPISTLRTSPEIIIIAIRTVDDQLLLLRMVILPIFHVHTNTFGYSKSRHCWFVVHHFFFCLFYILFTRPSLIILLFFPFVQFEPLKVRAIWIAFVLACDFFVFVFHMQYTKFTIQYIRCGTQL